MAKRKKHPCLPNGMGSIKFLGKGRRNPYGVYPPTKEFKENGSPVTPPAIAYVDDWYYGFSILMAYHAGTYVKDVYPPPPPLKRDADNIDQLIENILTDYTRAFHRTGSTLTFAEVYEMYFDYKFRSEHKKKLSKSAENAAKTAFKNCAALHDKIFVDLRYDDLQAVVDNCPLKHASLELIVSLFHQMYAFAEMKEICTNDYSRHVHINREDDDEHGIPFSEADLSILWKNQNDPTVEMLLIMCYSGYRIMAYKTLEVNLQERYFKGGVKTTSSKDRIVPIHSAISPLVERRVKRLGSLLPMSVQEFRNNMYITLSNLKIERHTPHDCRHTFSALCEKYGVNENDRKRMLGHSFGADITNGVYGHRELEDLRHEIEKIKIPSLLLTT